MKFVYNFLRVCIVFLFSLLILYIVFIKNDTSVSHNGLSMSRNHSSFVTKLSWLPININIQIDVLVYIHIQKTGGSYFLQHVVSMKNKSRSLCHQPNPGLKKKLKKKKDIVICPITETYTSRVSHGRTIPPEMWLASEKTYGWVCGLHPFLIEMKSCLSEYLDYNYGTRYRKFHYLTILRHPVVRYISEYLHVKRGATWPYHHICADKVLGKAEMPPCYSGYYRGYVWINVTLDKFMSCSSNWANNRQTLMLADLESVDCLNPYKFTQKEREARLLQSAKDNLREMIFFGISEYMMESGQLLQYRLSLQLPDLLKQKDLRFLHTKWLFADIWRNTALYNQIVQINKLDMQLYHFALQLFNERLQVLNINIDLKKLDNSILNLKV